MMRTASFGLAVLYTLLFAASVSILGVVFYLIVQNSLDRQIASRIDAEIALLYQELTSEGKDALVAESRLPRARLSRARCRRQSACRQFTLNAEYGWLDRPK
jgi:hypothetical protein